MSEDFDAFIHRLDGLLEELSPSERRATARALANMLRARQSKRIGEQKNPDGSAYEPRKPNLRNRRQGRGALRRKMFATLRTARYLKTETSADHAAVQFIDSVQRIAQVHHNGLRDRVNRQRGPEYDYPARQLLGLDAASLSAVEDILLARLTNKRL